MTAIIIWFLGWAFTWGFLYRYCDTWWDRLSMPAVLLFAWPLFFLMEVIHGGEHEEG